MRYSLAMLARVRRGGVAAAAMVVPLLFVTSCQGDRALGVGDKERASAVVSIVPTHGAKKVRPDRPIVVTVSNGTLENVTVANKGTKVEGVMSGDKTQWRSRWTLEPNARFTVTATAKNEAGKRTQTRSVFSTVKPSETFAIADITPMEDETVGVGMPVIIYFNRTVSNRSEVERALEVQMSKPVEAAWHWQNGQYVHLRPRKYWPKGQRIKIIAHLTGVRGAKNTYGTRDYTREFTVGPAQISVIDAKRAHMMTVKRDGKVLRRVPISAGKATQWKYTTTNGIHLAMSKEYHTVMDSATVGIPKGHPDYYKLDVYWTVRISNSGEYVHSAPWSVSAQGRSNVSHGCVNASPANAKWFNKITQRGDVIIVSGTRRPLDRWNGWAHWVIPWKEWVKGSALKRSINAPQPGSSTSTTAATLPANPSSGGSQSPTPQRPTRVGPPPQ